MNVDQLLRSIDVAFPDTPDVAPAVLTRLSEPARSPWWQRPRVAAAMAAVGVTVLVVGLLPAAREQVASWLGIGGVEVEVVEPVSPTSTSTSTSTSTPQRGRVGAGLGEGLVLGREVLRTDLDEAAGFDVLFPRLGLPDRQFVDSEGRVWLLYRTRVGLPEMEQVPGIGLIVTQFEPESPGIVKQVFPDGAEFVETEQLFGLWLPGPHDLILPGADGSAVDGRSAGNTLLWEHSDDLTIRIETALPLDEALAIAESFE